MNARLLEFTFVEKRLPNYRDRVRLEPFQETPDTGIFLRLPNLNSIDNPINFQGTNYGTHTSLTSENDSDARDIERILISGSLLDVQPNIEYGQTTTDLTIESDDYGFGNFVHFSSAETRIRNFEKKLKLIEGYNSDSSSLVSISSSLETIQEIERKRQRVKNSFDPFEHYSDEAIKEALSDVQMLNAIENLTDGLHSHVAENGSNFIKVFLCPSVVMSKSISPPI